MDGNEKGLAEGLGLGRTEGIGLGRAEGANKIVELIKSGLSPDEA